MKEVLIKTEDLCKSFITDKVGNNILKNLNIEIYKGDFTIIMGSSGAGKSTLLYSLSTMDTPTSGKVFLNNKDITKLSEKEASEIRNKDISFIFQGINLLPDLTIYENVAYTALVNNKDKNAVRKKVNTLLKNFELLEHKDKYPSEVSGGMQQRTAIARAIVNNPKVIFGDEPTGALNSSMGTRVLDILCDLNKEGQSIVMVTHDMKAALRGSRILYLQDGRIKDTLELGKYDEEKLDSRRNILKDFLEEQGW